ncbi:MAG: 2-amino-4-hydroxy-6-hydroxymethyldihydropteridine diphosphokinase [Bacteroidetes bacterium]|nr:2-amino-4-hydroxy-6-hydroxymethyldihydropteridine diphosphokinase [Bacteroidota bacterium]MBU1371396.1 2-amino-4-hydroxy-6-hydroxymethyldihydropteridine diphosphokinase [Bacteroidota bacterium]MBU1485667.1 2-amino-4-hydroxy-6-hydroxymethyldihydropteridine diphosphokinase [Bacteroidota bacterium]MBU2266929.1 2-amino-4-hydroxy-6-hydroxymethyldihydropteridine diphosphokinase [Bacteroidota bacterium]MBU2375771.1 2-amino-4-hydroxy-6-hydroxymethyldihydropteridine diphosphokinase [Bacteroidota bact
MSRVFLSIGGNLGDRFENFNLTLANISEHIGIIKKQSSIYETKAWGKENQPDYLNMVLEVETIFLPEKLLKMTQQIEINLGRVRYEKWDARTIDIDILFYDNEIVNLDYLKIPHPLINIRKFVLLPMLEIAADFIHPVLNQSIKNMYLSCTDDLAVNKLNFKNSI